MSGPWLYTYFRDNQSYLDQIAYLLFQIKCEGMSSSNLGSLSSFQIWFFKRRNGRGFPIWTLRRRVVSCSARRESTAVARHCAAPRVLIEEETEMHLWAKWKTIFPLVVSPSSPLILGRSNLGKYRSKNHSSGSYFRDNVQSQGRAYRVTIQNWTLDMELLCMLFRRCLSNFTNISPKQHSE